MTLAVHLYVLALLLFLWWRERALGHVIGEIKSAAEEMEVLWPKVESMAIGRRRWEAA